MVLSLHGVSTLTENTCLAGFEKLLKQPCALQYTALVARWYFGKSKGMDDDDEPRMNKSSCALSLALSDSLQLV